MEQICGKCLKTFDYTGHSCGCNINYSNIPACPDCGKEILGDNHICFTTKSAPFIGWVCPVCGKGNSPYCLTCPCVSDMTFSWS